MADKVVPRDDRAWPRISAVFSAALAPWSGAVHAWWPLLPAAGCRSWLWPRNAFAARFGYGVATTVRAMRHPPDVAVKTV